MGNSKREYQQQKEANEKVYSKQEAKMLAVEFAHWASHEHKKYLDKTWEEIYDIFKKTK